MLSFVLAQQVYSINQSIIANHISALRTQAKQLQQQAVASLEQAKQQVE
jgi:hypothetical protein